jgi:hypothetical protein
MGDLFKPVAGTDGKFSWAALVGFVALVLVTVAVANRVPAIRQLVKGG